MHATMRRAENGFARTELACSLCDACNNPTQAVSPPPQTADRDQTDDRQACMRRTYIELLLLHLLQTQALLVLHKSQRVLLLPEGLHVGGD
jgi:hypothetical protein